MARVLRQMGKRANLLIIAVAVCFAFAEVPVQAGIITVTNDPTGTGRPAFGGTDIVDWGVLGPSFTAIPAPFGINSVGGLGLTVSHLGSFFERRDLNNGWGGNFTDGNILLWTQGSNAPMTIDFASAVKGIGFQINPNFSDTSTTVEVFGAGNVSFGSFNLITNSRATPSGSFIGFTSSLTDITRITLTQAPNRDFAINQLSLIRTTDSAVPEPTTLTMFGLGGALSLAFAGYRRRKLAR
jgi:hypothetical protein